MSKITLDPNALEVASYDPTPAPGGEDQAQTTPTIVIGTYLLGAAISDAYC